MLMANASVTFQPLEVERLQDADQRLRRLYLPLDLDRISFTPIRLDIEATSARLSIRLTIRS